ncbi:MAG: hypothetical protein NVSMB60_20950 [Mycobacterium sp.]
MPQGKGIYDDDAADEKRLARLERAEGTIDEKTPDVDKTAEEPTA